MITGPKSKIETWFTESEIQGLITEIITKIQLCEIPIGNIDDQLLLMYLMKDISEE